MYSLAGDVPFDSKLLLVLRTTYSSYSLSIKALNSLRVEATEMLIKGVSSLHVFLFYKDDAYKHIQAQVL